MDDLEKHQINEDFLDALSNLIDDYSYDEWLKYYIDQLKEMRLEFKQEFEEEEERLQEQRKKEIKAQFDEYWKSQF